MQAAIQESRNTLAKAGLAADQLAAMSTNANALLNDEGKPMMGDLRKTLAAANGSLSALESALNSTAPTIQTLNTQTLPEINQLARDLRQMASSLKNITDRLDQQGVGGLVSAPELPNYKPK